MNFPEFLSSLHGFLATIYLMSFAGAFAELVELTHAGIRRVKWGVSLMALTAILLVTSGLWTYIFYRAPVPDSPRSILKASPTPWVHEIIFELKEHIGTFVPAIMLVALYIVFRHSHELQADKKLRLTAAGVLTLSLIWTLLTFALGVYVTKIAPL
jgi:hypothetical protein